MRLHSERFNVVLRVSDPAIKKDYFEDTEGLRWNKTIEPKHLKMFGSDYFARSETEDNERG